MKRYVTVATALAAVAIVLLLLPLTAGAGSEKQFVLSWRGTFTGPTSGAGTFAVGGAINDAGTFAATFTSQEGKQNCEAIAGDDTFTGASGTVSMHFVGLSCASSPTDPRPPFDGRFNITGGTGAYAGISGGGTITSLADFSDGTFTGIHVGTAHLEK